MDISAAYNLAECFAARPLTRFRHIRKERGFMCPRIILITSGSDNPVWALILSKLVSSSQAIATISEVVMSPLSGRGVAGTKSSGNFLLVMT